MPDTISSGQFHSLLKKEFPFAPTLKQDLFFQMASVFLSGPADRIFVLKGYAGTGKTSVISALVRSLGAIGQKSSLLAPTGRAAKVIAGYSGKQAFTIHKKIYFPKKSPGGISFTMQANKHRNTVFIVDEASMISDASIDPRTFQSRSLLEDLVRYIASGDNCRLLLLGDTAQLPPVGLENSPALDTEWLQREFHSEILSLELDQVMRQEEGSGILYNATVLREWLDDRFAGEFRFNLDFPDIVRLTDGYDIQDALYAAYGRNTLEETAFIVRSNKRANLYNQQIRLRILDKESELSAGDYLMVVKNNYHWLKDSDHAGFIANGDVIEVLEIFRIMELYTFRFARVKVRMIDYPDQAPFETVLLLDTLTSESASLSGEESGRLYREVLADYESEGAQYKKLQKVKENEYFNALQVKFSYAMTCHKSQGGQWESVFIEQPYLPDGINRDYIRWLYTAVTRARSKLFLINFTDDYFI